MAEDTEEADLLKAVEEQIRLLEEGESVDEFLFEEEAPADPLDQARKDFQVPESMMSNVEEMKAQMENASQLENLSEEERANLRERLLSFETKGTFIVF